MKVFQENIIRLLKSGGVGVIPTDTLYGMVASALNPDAVERVSVIRKRDADKAYIILIAEISELERFSVKLAPKEKAWLETVWPGKISVRLACEDGQWRYLSRGTESLVFRVPDDEALRALLREVGPLVAPSANIQGEPPAETKAEVDRYFGDNIDFFVDGGILQSEPSTIVKLENDQVSIIRPGAIRIKTGDL